MLHHRAIDYARTGRRDEALRLVNELEQRARTEYLSPGARGLIWIELGEADRGYALVKTACAERDARIRELKANAVYADLRGDPRFHRILKCMNLE